MIKYLGGILGLVLVVLGLTMPVMVAVRQQQHTKNFHVVREGVLYRSAQMTLPGLQRIVHDHGIRTVVSLREGVDGTDLAEERYCNSQEIRFVRLLPKRWDRSTGVAPVDDNVRTFLEIMRDPSNHPVLVHCFAGIHRTGAYCAIYRMEFDNWANAEAIDEIKALGYVNFDREWDIRGYLEHYHKGQFVRSFTAGPDTVPLAEGLRRLAVEADLNDNFTEAIRYYDRIVESFAESYPDLVYKSQARAEYLRDELAAQKGEIPKPLHSPQLP